MLGFSRHFISSPFYKQLALFISSYLPLYLWLLFSSFDYAHIINIICESQSANIELTDIYINVALIVLIIFSIIWLIITLNSTSGESQKLSKHLKIKPNSDSMMNYLITYIVPLMNFDRNSLSSISSNLFLFTLIALLYSVNNVTFLNPTLGLLKYKVYEVEGDVKMHHILTKKTYNELIDLQTNSETSNTIECYVHFQNIADGVFLIK